MCKSYRRSSGVFVYHGVRCLLIAGHKGQHYAPGRYFDLRQAHRWGRA